MGDWRCKNQCRMNMAIELHDESWYVNVISVAMKTVPLIRNTSHTLSDLSGSHFMYIYHLAFGI